MPLVGRTSVEFCLLLKFDLEDEKSESGHLACQRLVIPVDCKKTQWLFVRRLVFAIRTGVRRFHRISL